MTSRDQNLKAKYLGHVTMKLVIEKSISIIEKYSSHIYVIASVSLFIFKKIRYQTKGLSRAWHNTSIYCTFRW